MEKGQGIESNDCTKLLPIEVIQCIQSFMAGKEACRTSILSKLWRLAWLTRPDLDFNDKDSQTTSLFEEFVSKTIQRYLDLNLKIESFKLRAIYKQLSTEPVVKAMKLDPIHLHLDSYIDLPKEVLHSKKLIQVSLLRCGIASGNVDWMMLNSLELRQVNAKDDVIIGILSSCCHSLRKLTISSCGYPIKDQHVRFQYPKIKRFTLDNSNRFPNLKFLWLKQIKIHPNFFDDDFSSRFPSLKDLSVINCHIQTNSIRISSPSVERVQTTLAMVQLDFPRIRKLEFSGVGSTLKTPALFSIGTFCGEWESRIFIRLDQNCGGDHSASFLRALKHFLWQLRWSKIYLHLTASSTFIFNDVKDGELQYLPPVVVENLTVDVSSSCRCAFFGALYRVCIAMHINEPSTYS